MTAKYNLLKVFSIIAILAMTFSNVQPAHVQAQSGDGLNRQVNAESGRVSFITPADGKPLSAVHTLGQSIRPQDPAMALAAKYAPEFGLENAERSLTAMESNRSDDGRLTVRFQQNFENVPVMGGELIVNTNDNGDLYSISGEVSPGLSLSTTPAIDADQARKTALQAMAKWYEKTPDEFVSTDPALWIYDESLLQASTRPVELTWRMEVTTKEGSLPVRELVLVNAQRGNISLHFNQVDTTWKSSKRADDVPPTPTPEPPQPSEPPFSTDVPEVDVTPMPSQELPSTSQTTDIQSAEEATAKTLYVATTGNDTNTCLTPAAPCKKIGAAISKAVANDTIRIAIGTYKESFQIEKNISLSGGWNASFTTQNGVSTVDGEQNLQILVSVYTYATVILERFVIQNAAFTGIYNTGGLLTINDSIIRNNNATPSSGGGIFNGSSYPNPMDPVGIGGQLSLNNSTVSNNQGNGVSNLGLASVSTINNSTVSYNTDTGVMNWDGAVTLNNSTVSGNSARYTGGGLSNNTGTLSLNNSTVSANKAPYGGGIYRNAGTVTLKNTIMAGNISTNNGPDCYGVIQSAGYNLIQNTAGCSLTSGTGDIINVNAHLGGLIGSPAYHFLLSGSPAIDGGNPAIPGSGGNACLATDQRGNPRPFGVRCDIGSYEYTISSGSAASLLIAQGDNQHAVPGRNFTQPFKVAALDDQGNPVSGVSITFTAPASGASGTFAGNGTPTTTVVTGEDGIATTSIFSANTAVGSYSVTASADGVGSVSFTLHNFFWYIAPNGSDQGNCWNPSTPCATVNWTVNQAGFVPGDTVLAASGTYVDEAMISRDAIVRGGWNAAFTAQDGMSIIDGQGSHQGMLVFDQVTATVERYIIQNGYAYSGGGIENRGTLILNDSLVQNNKCCETNNEGGGGIYNLYRLTINNSTIAGNISSGMGGGILSTDDSILLLNNSTISGNEANAGGGIFSTGTVVMNNSTITKNKAVNNGSGGGIEFKGTGYGYTFTVQNSLVAGNQAINGGPDCSGSIVSAGYNLIGNNSGCDYVAEFGDLVGTSSNLIDPQLAPLYTYGGLTPSHALKTGSPAVDAGNPGTPGSGGNTCLGSDQRGTVRPVGTACDIGSFEQGVTGTAPVYIVPYSGTPQKVVEGSSTDPLKVLVINELGETFSGVTVTFTAPASGASGTFLSTNTKIATAITDANGIATAPVFRANYTAGTYSISATISGVAAPAYFQITNFLPSVRTYTANHTSTLPGAFLCTEAYSSCTMGYNPHADKAHLYAMGTFQFFSTKHGRAGIDQNYMPIISTVNYCGKNNSGNTVCPYYNAAWTGEQMVYGDPYGFPLADDVVAHELTHGVTQYESNLFYYYQSGAINESFSDLWGEYYDQTNGKGNDATAVKWIIGEDVSGYPKPAGFSVPAMRSMSNPPALQDPDKMTSIYYYKGEEDNGGVHTNSSVNNKAVYLMVQGGTFNGKTVTALGWDKTAAIYYEVNTNLLTSGADYSDLYFALQTACAGLLGQKGIVASDCTEVKDAIDAVQMNSQPATNFNTDAPQCPANGTYPKTVLSDDLENGTGNWVFVNGSYPRWQYDSPYGLFAQSGQHSLYADDYPQNDDIPSNAEAILYSLTVPANGYLWFAHAYDFEYDSAGYYDGGVLEYSKDNGFTWIDAAPLIQYNGYKGRVSSDYDNPLSGQSAFVGASHGYISTRLNLASLAGQSVSFRWRMGLDGYVTAWGWWVDNVQVYTCEATTFADVPFSHPFYNDIEILYANGLTGGCSTSPLKFCPDQIMNRGQAAAFILRGNFGSSYVPPLPTHVFKDDWSKGTWAEGWAEGMRNEGLSAGCSSNPLKYCPWDLIPREQAVIFALRMKYGTGYTPPPATGTVFADMTNPGYYATSWAEQAYTDGIIPDCGIDGVSGKPNFCPKVLVSRGLAAYMIVKAKGLTMP